MKTTFSYPKWAEIPNIDLLSGPGFALCQSGLRPYLS
ncbi:BS_ykrK family protein [Streptococcus pneumoniae]|nr:BS_ykrK family protein [Streptococcus pneumoniae]